MKIAITTDNHYGYSNKGDYLNEQMFIKLKEEKPDLILQSGDYGSHCVKNRHDFWTIVRTYHPTIPIGAVSGNHDFWCDKVYDWWSTIDEVIEDNQKILDHQKVQLLKGSTNLTFENISIFGFDGWYHRETESNDKYQIPGYMPFGYEKLNSRANKDFESILRNVEKLKSTKPDQKIILMTHFGFIEEDSKNDWKATKYGEYFGANPKYEDFLDDVDYLIYGHSHRPFHGVAKNGKTKVINVGSDYEDPKYEILEIE